MRKKRLLALLLSACIAFAPVVNVNAEIGTQQDAGAKAGQASPGTSGGTVSGGDGAATNSSEWSETITENFEGADIGT